MKQGTLVAAGVTVGGYHLVRLLGRGGMSEVWEAVHGTLGIRRALKIFTAEGESAEFLRSRFLAEGKLLARFDHPHLMRVYDCGVDEATGTAYLVMDLVLGDDGLPHTLSSLQKERRITEERLFGWYADLADALRHVHAAGVVHRDVKPSNVLVDADGRAVLADFGVSRIEDEALRRELAVERTMATGVSGLSRVVLGTTAYLAPEVLAGGDATAASDLYALGVTLFRLLTGMWYEPGSSAQSLLDGLDPAWRGLFAALLDPDPAKRSLPPVRPARRGRVRARRVLVAALAAVALAAAGVAAVRLIARPSAGAVPPPGDRRAEDLFFTLEE